MYLLDTNVCIHFMKNSVPILTDRLLAHDPSELAISSITVLELEYGAAKSNWGSKTRNQMKMFLAPFTILPFDANDAIAAGRIRRYLETKGTVIGVDDIGSIMVAWDNGSGLSVAYGADVCRVVNDDE